MGLISVAVAGLLVWAIELNDSVSSVHPARPEVKVGGTAPTPENHAPVQSPSERCPASVDGGVGAQAASAPAGGVSGSSLASDIDAHPDFLPVPCTEEQYAEKYKGQSSEQLMITALRLRDRLNEEFQQYAEVRKNLGLVDRRRSPSGGQVDLATPDGAPIGMGQVQRQIGGDANADGTMTVETVYITEAEYPDYFLRYKEYDWLIKEWYLRRKK